MPRKIPSEIYPGFFLNVSEYFLWILSEIFPAIHLVISPETSSANTLGIPPGFALGISAGILSGIFSGIAPEKNVSLFTQELL